MSGRERFRQERVARLATADAAGRPHLVPLVFAMEGDLIYSAVDWKPKRRAALRRLDNVRANPAVAVLADQYEDDWTRLWWVRAEGRASVLEDGPESGHAIELLAAKYPQYAARRPRGPVLRIAVERWSSWP